MFFYSVFSLCVLFFPRLFCAVISYVFLPALPWLPERVSNALVGLLTLRLPSLGLIFLMSSLCLRFSFLPRTFVSGLFACCHSRAGSLLMFYHAVLLVFPVRIPCLALSKYQQSIVVSLYSEFMSTFVPPLHLQCWRTGFLFFEFGTQF